VSRIDAEALADCSLVFVRLQRSYDRLVSCFVLVRGIYCQVTDNKRENCQLKQEINIFNMSEDLVVTAACTICCRSSLGKKTSQTCHSVNSEHVQRCWRTYALAIERPVKTSAEWILSSVEYQELLAHQWLTYVTQYMPSRSTRT